MNAVNFALKIDSPAAAAVAAQLRLLSWPPPRDFPVVVATDGTVVSRYGDQIWDLSLWAGSPRRLNFGDGPRLNAASPVVDAQNADVLRQVVFWWMFGPNGFKSVRTIQTNFELIRTLFVHCSEQGVHASALHRFPAVVDSLGKRVAPSSGSFFFALMHDLYIDRDQLGFVILDREALRRFGEAIPDHERRQTVYIPPRIWNYQVSRLRAFLDDFHAHREGIEACFRFCLDAYASNYGSLEAACSSDRDTGRGPFNTDALERVGARYLGPFSETAERFGINHLIERWCLTDGRTLRETGIRQFSRYLTAVGEVGTRYLINFSLMRIEETSYLRADCLKVEQDPHFGPIYLLTGETTKTSADDNACWVTSPSAEVAVEAMAAVARLRMLAAEARPAAKVTEEDKRNPRLVQRGYEPWSPGRAKSLSVDLRKCTAPYSAVSKSLPALFDPAMLRITAADLDIARLVTPSLDDTVFVVGQEWPLAFHQLRRTGSVNMQSSGLVSDASLQYQLKHVSRAMSLYYGQGYSRVALNASARSEYLKTMYEVIGKEVAQLFSPRFVSPLGESHKANILRLVDPSDVKKLRAAAKAGQVSFRETLLGGCTKRGPCEYGGIDNIARCGGGDGDGPCPEALYDREKAPQIEALGRLIAVQLITAPEGSPLRESLDAQQRSVEHALSVLAT